MFDVPIDCRLISETNYYYLYSAHTNIIVYIMLVLFLIFNLQNKDFIWVNFLCEPDYFLAKSIQFA